MMSPLLISSIFQAVILVHDTKKHFYKKFLYEPFPVESKLADVLADHLNAEIVSGSVFSKQSAVEFLTWTYFFRRLAQNPSFYGLERVDQKNMNYYLSKLIQNTIAALQEADCCVVNENDTITPTTLGAIASFYYLKHSTVGMLSKALVDKLQHSDLLRIMSNASEFAEVPVRHNEEHFNAQLAAVLPWKVGKDSYDRHALPGRKSLEVS
jgi:activating signal cointegrator complex subunit 3